MTKYQIQWKYDNGFDTWHPASTWVSLIDADIELARCKEYEDDSYWRLVEITERVIG
jgi:hypothetical protein